MTYDNRILQHALDKWILFESNRDLYGEHHEYTISASLEYKSAVELVRICKLWDSYIARMEVYSG
jgi:hypothetical protein